MEYVLFSVFCLATLVLKERLSLRLAEVVLVILFFGMGIHGIFAGDNYLFASYYHRFAVIGQLAICHLLASPRFIAIPNAINFLIQLGVLYFSPALQANLTQNFTCFCTSAFLNLAISAGASAGLRAESRALVAGRTASQGEATAMSLLSAMCDAVCRLRPDLTLKACCPQLNAILFRTAAGIQNSEPDSFTRFVCGEDVARFEEFMKKQTEMPTKAAALHLHLMDSMGGRVPVRIFHTCTVGHDGTLGHMIGINEDSQEQRDSFAANLVASRSERAPSSGPEVHHAQDWQDFARIIPSIPSGLDSVSVAQSSVSAHSDAGGCTALTVTVRTSLAVQVIQESEMSRMMFCFGGDSQLMFLQRFKEWQKLLTTLELMHAEAACGAAPDSQKFGEVTLQAIQTDFKGTMKIRPIPKEVEPSGAEGASPGSSSDSQGPIKLNYTDFELKFKTGVKTRTRDFIAQQQNRLWQRANDQTAPAEVGAVVTLPGQVQSLLREP